MPGMSRRLLLAPAVLAALLVPGAVDGAHATGASTDCLASVRGVDIVRSTVPQLQAALAARRLTSRQLTQGYLRRIAAIDHGALKVNAIRAITKDALAQADASDARRRAHRTRGPLDGLPVLLKDNVGTKDAPTTAGSIALAKNFPKREATIVAKLRAAGAVILGKTNLSEFANWVDPTMPNGYSSLGGQVKNPYNGGDPSGSSSGSGAAATLGFAAVTIGTETSGSILSPSDVESIVGVKPTVGLVSRAGVIPLAQSFDTAGPMVRTVTDAAYLLQAISGRDPRDTPYLEAPGGPPVRPDYPGALKPGALRGARLGYSTQDVPSGPGGALYNQALDAMRKAGATLVETDTLVNTSLVGLTELSAIFNEFKYGLNNYLATEAGPGLPVKTMNDVVLYNQQHPDKVKYGQTYIIASDAQPGVYDEPSAIAERTSTIVAARQAIDSVLVDNKIDAYLTPGSSYANIGAAAGYPTVIVPAGLAGATPMGIGFLGHAWTERSLLAMAYDYERVSHRRVPATQANPVLLDGHC
ncbi:MAG: amidase [Frankiales bacterium]|nr:amidase [Frankiales bacterium]